MSSYKLLMERKTLIERKAFYESWKRSGLTKNKFCRQNNIGRRTFFTWIKQLQNNNYIDNNDILNTADDSVNLKADPIKFLEVSHASSQKNPDLELGSLEISLTDGTIIKTTVS